MLGYLDRDGATDSCDNGRFLLCVEHGFMALGGGDGVWNPSVKLFITGFYQHARLAIDNKPTLVVSSGKLDTNQYAYLAEISTFATLGPMCGQRR